MSLYWDLISGNCSKYRLRIWAEDRQRECSRTLLQTNSIRIRTLEDMLSNGWSLCGWRQTNWPNFWRWHNNQRFNTQQLFDIWTNLKKLSKNNKKKSLQNVPVVSTEWTFTLTIYVSFVQQKQSVFRFFRCNIAKIISLKKSTVFRTLASQEWNTKIFL